MQHQRLVTYLLDQKEITGMTLAEISRRAGLNDGQLSNIVNGVVPGLKLCRHSEIQWASSTTKRETLSVMRCSLKRSFLNRSTETIRILTSPFFAA